MSAVKNLLDGVEALVGSEPRSLAVFSAGWPLARALKLPPDAVAEGISSGLSRRFPSATILMPTFTYGFGTTGLCDLDKEPSSTGVVTETFRRRKDVRRTRSAFFSFGVTGPDRDALVALAPVHAWGDGSVYDWMYRHDTIIVTLGLHPTHCSFSHYAEWRHRDRVPYRFEKLFSGTLRHEGKDLPWSETLYVRKKAPAPMNDFKPALPRYLAAGMKTETVEGAAISAISARTKTRVLDSYLDEDPLSLIENRKQFEAHV